MEGVGSTRLGRASARYGSTAVFNGPVRKWKKKWVHVSPSSTVKHSQSNGNGSATTSIVLCRWTPLTATDSGSSAAVSTVDGEDEEQPPKRKFRYTPVAVLEEERRRAAAKQVEDEAKADENEINRSPDWLSSKRDNEFNMNKDPKKETQHSSVGNLDLGLCLKGLNDSHDSAEKEGQEKVASSAAGFWKMG
ncbi:hypothetical protein COLO4_09732 [Corchorus olitorius]|uniref:Uncharacterized protein n=1 Tax=Corchorus olitorius TaxID=93759 RepID=A0A1R3KB53_9ROSI|nr:hypothetical protein COLO4_09732 [Corchorus olitorius]